MYIAWASVRNACVLTIFDKIAMNDQNSKNHEFLFTLNKYVRHALSVFGHKAI